MTTATFRAHLRRPAAETGGLAVHAELVAVAGLVAWCGLLVALTWGTWGDLGRDTGFDLLAAERTAGGELPYADYVYYYGPATPLLLGWIYAVAGPSVGAAIGLGLALAGLIVALTYALARRLAGPLGAAPAAALAATAAFGSANNSFVMPHSFSAPLAVALALAVVLALVGFARDGGRGRLVAAGVLAGLAAITRPELAASVALCLVAWAVLRVAAAPGGRRPAVRDATALIGPALAVPLAVYGAFATQVPVRELLFENLYPVDAIDQAGRVVLRGLAPLTPESFVELGARLALYGLGVAALLAAGAALARGGRARVAVAIAAGLAALVFLAVVAARPETVRYYLQYAYGWIPAGAWVAAGAVAWHLRRRGTLWTAEGQAPLLLSLLLAAAASTAYGAFYPHPRPDFPQATAYLMPLVAAFLAWLHVAVIPRGRHATVLGAGWVALLALASAGLLIGDARKETVTVSGAHGSMTAEPAEGPAMQAAVAAIEEQTRPGEPILLAPQLTALYVMTDRANPLPQLSLLPGALATPADEERALARMGDVRLAITDRRRLGLYGHGAFGETFDRRLGEWLRADFELARTVRGDGASPRMLDVWIRNGP